MQSRCWVAPQPDALPSKGELQAGPASVVGVDQSHKASNLEAADNDLQRQFTHSTADKNHAKT